MPTAAAQHQADIGVLADDSAGQARQVALQADVDDIDEWWSSAGPQLTRSIARAAAATATLAGRYLVVEAALAGFELDPVQVAVDAAQIATSLRVTGPVAFKVKMRRSGSPEVARRTMATQLAGSAQRLTLAGSRQTIVATAEASPSITRYRRITQSGACDFCSMLAGRGDVYTRESAGQVVGRSGRPRGNRRIGQSYHDHCRCYVAVSFEGGGQAPPPPPPPERPRVERRPAPPPEPPRPAPVPLDRFDAEDAGADWAAAVGGRRNEVVDVASGPRARSVNGAPGPGVALVDDEGRLFYSEIQVGGAAPLSERFLTGFRPDAAADRAAAARRVEEMRAEVTRSLPVGMRGAPAHLSVRGRSTEDAVWDRIHGLPPGSFYSAANANQGRVVHFGGRVNPSTVWHENGHVVAFETNRRLAGSGAADLIGSGAAPGPGWRDAALRDAQHQPPLSLAGFTQRDPAQKEIRPAGTGSFAGSQRPAVTDYGASAPDGSEDFAEAWRLYVEDRDHGSIGSDGSGRPVRFRDLFPNRAAYFDRMAQAAGLDITRGS